RKPTGGRAQLATAGPEAAQAPALVARQATPPAEEVAVLPSGHELRDSGVEQPHGAREAIRCEGRHGVLDIGPRPPLGRAGEAEERAGEDVALEANERPLARRPAQRDQLLQRAEQECTGTYGGVHYLEAPQVREPRGQRGPTVVDPALRRLSGKAEPADEHGL